MTEESLRSKIPVNRVTIDDIRAAAQRIEAYVHRTHHPRWTREDLPEEGMGLWLYQNAVTFIRDELL